MYKAFFSTFLLLFLASYINAAVLTVTDVSDDALISSSTAISPDTGVAYRDNNYGDLTHINICTYSVTNFQATYIRFDLSQSLIDTLLNSTIESAVLRLFRYYAPYENFQYIDIHSVPTAWTETSITWNNQPIMTMSAETGYTNEYLYDTQYVGLEDEAGWIEFEVTGIVQAWVDGTYPNYGIKLEVNEDSYNYETFVFSSRSSEYGLSTVTPRIEITYSVPIPEPHSILMLLSGILFWIGKIQKNLL